MGKFVSKCNSAIRQDAAYFKCCLRVQTGTGKKLQLFLLAEQNFHYSQAGNIHGNGIFHVDLRE